MLTFKVLPLDKEGPIAERFNSLVHGRGNPGSNPHRANIFFEDEELSITCMDGYVANQKPCVLLYKAHSDRLLDKLLEPQY